MPKLLLKKPKEKISNNFLFKNSFSLSPSPSTESNERIYRELLGFSGVLGGMMKMDEMSPIGLKFKCLL